VLCLDGSTYSCKDINVLNNDVHTSKHVGAVECVNKLSELVHLLIRCIHRTKMHDIKVKKLIIQLYIF
jgi:hypothetical protein